MSGTSRRAQPVRQTRTNPPRASGFPLSRATDGLLDTAPTLTMAPGFFPAITHFADSITALPKEIVRHFTLLKEVDAKACGPEETLGQLTDLALNTPTPKQRQTSIGIGLGDTSDASGRVSAATAEDGPTASNQGPVVTEAPDMARRHLFLNLRFVLSEMLMTLDEKNHVITTANEALQKQILRLDSSFPYIDNEISEEARHGSLTHWAYIDKSNGRVNGAAAGERSRREVAAANNLAAAAAALNDDAAARSESRREAMHAKKHRNHPADLDIDDSRQGRHRDQGLNPTLGHHGNKRARGSSKVRKTADGGPNAMGLGISEAGPVGMGNPLVKKRRTEKATNGIHAAATSMERSLSGTPANGSGGRSSIGGPEAPFTDGRKRPRGGGALAGATRKRNTTNASGMQSPGMASSPVHNTFAASKDSHRGSPNPAASQRPASGRVRKNSSQSLAQDATVHPRHRPSSSASNRTPNANGVSAATADLKNIAGLTGRSVSEVKTSMKEAVNAKGEHLIEAGEGNGNGNGNGNGESELRGALVSSSRAKDGSERSLKREDTESNNGGSMQNIRHTSVTTSTRKASKNSTPVTATFSDSHKSRARPSRAEPTVKRSHKKGASAAAAQQLMASTTVNAASTPDEEGSSMQGDDEEEDDEAEPRYCYCNQVSFGEMVACDADTCPREWFHLSCVGLAKAPNKNAKWYCDECKDSLKKGKFGVAAR